MGNFLHTVEEMLTISFAEYNIKSRPFAAPGVCYQFLLPGIIAVNRYKYVGVSDVYMLSSELSVGLLVAGVILVLAIYSSESKKEHSFNSGMIFPFAFTSFRLYFFYERGLIYSMIFGLLSSYAFSTGFVTLMRLFPKCFTFGEAAIGTQALILFLFSCIENIHKAWYIVPEQDTDVATIILQVGLLGIFAICITLYCIPSFHTTCSFYGVVFGILFFGVIPYLHLLLRRSPVLWIVSLIWTDDSRIVRLFSYWILCVGVAACAVAIQVTEGQQASTTVRKYFHILAVAVYFPGLVNACCLLYLASGIVLALFVILELVRVLDIPPLGRVLQNGFAVYADEKDAGNVALTPIYLLSGCSMPLWLHPLQCHYPDVLLTLCSGLLSVGVGDTSASYIGSHYGHHRWPGTNKTLEGTLACVISQMLAVCIMLSLGMVKVSNWATLVGGIVLSSIVEAKTDQVDNLVLPLISFLVI